MPNTPIETNSSGDQPVQPQAPLPPKRHVRTMTIIIAAVVIGLLFGGGSAAFLFGQNKTTSPTPTPPQVTPTISLMASPTTAPTLTWETYTNTLFGITFQYPGNWFG